jgi:hypothetical protein
MSPLAADQVRPMTSSEGVTRNANATWLNDWTFTPPVVARTSASASTDTSTAPALRV